MQFLIQMLGILTAKYVLFGILNIINTRNHNPSRFLRKIGDLGILFHEACHFVAAKLLFLPSHVSDINIKAYLPGISSGMTAVRSRDPQGLTFLQSVLIAFAPAILGTFAITELLQVMGVFWDSTVWQEWILLGVMILVILALMMVAFPSPADFKRIFEHMLKRPITTLRQLIICIGGYLVFRITQTDVQTLLPWPPIYFEPTVMIGIISSIEMAYVIISVIVGKLFHRTLDFNPTPPKLTAIHPSDLATLTPKKNMTPSELEKQFNAEFQI